MASEKELGLTISVERKVADTNYGNGGVFMAFINVTKDTTEEQMRSLLSEQGALAYKLLKEDLKAKVARALEI